MEKFPILTIYLDQERRMELSVQLLRNKFENFLHMVGLIFFQYS